MPVPASSTPAKAWGLWATLGFSAIVLMVFVAAQIVATILAMRFVQSRPIAPSELITVKGYVNGFLLAIATIVSSSLGTTLVLGFIQLRKRLSIREYLALKKPKLESLLRWILITIVFLVVSDLLKSLVDQPIVSIFLKQVYATAQVLPLLYLAVVIMAPIFEEVFFRGFLLKGLLHSRWGVTGAIVVPAGVWALVHSQYSGYDLLGVFGFGLLLGHARLKTSSLYVPIAMHMLNNLLAIVQVALELPL